MQLIKRFFLLIFSLTLIHFGCNKEEASIRNLFVPRAFSYKDLSKHNTGSGKPIKLIEKKQIILDSGEDVIGMIWNLKIVDNMFLVIDLVHSRRCYLFTDNGKLIRKIGRPGQGPGEYIFPRAGCVSGDRIFIAGAYRINIYKRNGDLIETKKMPFKGICNVLHEGRKGSVFALSYNRYNKKNHSIYHLDKNGDIIDTFSPIAGIPDVFDTFAPQTGLCVDNTAIFQFFNFKEEISVFDYSGNRIRSIKLSSPFYTKPNFRNAKNVRGHKAEKEYRASFSQTIGLFKYSGGYITELTNWKDAKTPQYILEFWDKDFKRVGYSEFNEGGRVLNVHNDMLITETLEEETKLVFWEFK